MPKVLLESHCVKINFLVQKFKFMKILAKKSSSIEYSYPKKSSNYLNFLDKNSDFETKNCLLNVKTYSF